MLVIRIELWSANSRQKTELARMHICNTGNGSHDKADYVGTTFRGRTTEALDRQSVVRTGVLTDWRRGSHHVWKLVATMLKQMGY